MEQSSFIKNVIAEIEQEKQEAMKNPSGYKPVQSKPFRIDYPGRGDASEQRSGLKAVINGNRYSRYLYSWLVTFVKMGKLRREIFDRLDRSDIRINELFERTQRNADRDIVLDQRLQAAENAILRLESNVGKLFGAKSAAGSIGSELLTETMTLDEYYFHFENQFRGSREQILSEVRIYLQPVKQTGIDFARFPVLDVGCGRGEWLESLKNEGIKSKGIDINRKMVGICNNLGLDATFGDAVGFLKALPEKSIGGITGFQVVEHIQFEALVEFLKECRRVLIPEGFVLFETPNPENYGVGSCDFYYDMSHVNPIPPAALGFLLGNVGFTKMNTIRSQPVTEDADELDNIENRALKRIAEKFFGPRNYAIFAQSTGRTI